MEPAGGNPPSHAWAARARRWSARIALTIWFGLALLIGSNPDYLHERLMQLSSQASWSVVDWEAEHLASGIRLVGGQSTAPPDDKAIAAQLADLFDKQRPGQTLDRDAERVLAAAVTEQLREGGVLPLGGAVFPPVAFSVDEPPAVLIVSPRNEIRQADAVVLDADIGLESAQRLEAAVERLGFSALVEQTGGISTYPTLVAPETNVFRALQTIAHEWTHTALFFKPLGQAYGQSAEARAINETTADLVGQEVATRAAAAAGASAAPRGASPNRELNDSLRRIRMNVDELLARGEVDDAEAYMEEERQALMGQGYNFRRLNQAYFAFHGNYAEGPAASTEVPDALRALRAQSGSLGDFIGRVGQVTTVEQLKALVGTPPATDEPA